MLKTKNNPQKVLLIAGGGTLGVYTAQALLASGFDVDIIALEKWISPIRGLRYIHSAVSDDLLKNLFVQTHYDCIIDFIHYPDPEAYKSRAMLELAHTSQLIFLSSYRVYAETAGPVCETSPRLLDVVKDQQFLTQETYAIPKAHCENYLRSLEIKNWTIVRPAISFSRFRLDLVTIGMPHLLSAAAMKLPLLLPEEARNKTAGVGWAGNIGKLMAGLVCNEKALGETFTLASAENLSWGEVADIYTDLLGVSFIWTDAETYWKHSADGSYMSRCILYADRLFDRWIDNRKVIAATQLNPNVEFKNIREGLIHELLTLAQTPVAVESAIEAGKPYLEKIQAYLNSL